MVGAIRDAVVVARCEYPIGVPFVSRGAIDAVAGSDD